MIEMIVIRGPPEFSSDHFPLRTRLLQWTDCCHRGYLRGRRAFPLALEMGPIILANMMFQVLKDMEKPPPSLAREPRSQWILAGSLILIDSILDHLSQPYHEQNMPCTLTKAVQKLLAVDTCCRAEVAVEEIGDCLETPQGTPSDIQGV